MIKKEKFLVWEKESQPYPFKVLAKSAEDAVVKLHLFLGRIVVPFKVERAADQKIWL